ncbi:MAG TPA: replication initiation factor domain-containing protein [Tissierellaceae bacterium]
MNSGENVQVSIDRLTIVAEDNLILHVGQLPSLYGLKFFGGRTDAYQIEIETLDDITGEVLVENIAFINFYAFGKDSTGIRVDFNPNRRKSLNSDDLAWKTLDKILMGMIGKKRLSRIDIAFDVFDSRMQNYRYFKSGVGKTIYSRDGQDETIYYGSPMSDKQIRQYNKQREQLKKGKRSDSWWRLELQLRTKYISKASEQIEEMLSWFKERDWSYIENVTDRAVLMALDVQPSLYSEFSKDKKTKINKQRKSSPNDDLAKELLDCYEKEKNNLELELQRYIAQHKIIF